MCEVQEGFASDWSGEQLELSKDEGGRYIPSTITLSEFVCMGQIRVTQFTFEVFTSKGNAMVLRDPCYQNDRVALQRS